MSKNIFGIFSVVLIAGCAATPDTVRPTTSEGLTPLSTSEIEQVLSGKSFEDVSGNWTWEFQNNGLAQSKAKDGEWEVQDQKWSVEDGKLCRSIENTYPCVHIYRTGDVLLFGKSESDALESWAITEL